MEFIMLKQWENQKVAQQYPRRLMGLSVKVTLNHWILFRQVVCSVIRCQHRQGRAGAVLQWAVPKTSELYPCVQRDLRSVLAGANPQGVRGGLRQHTYLRSQVTLSYTVLNLLPNLSKLLWNNFTGEIILLNSSWGWNTGDRPGYIWKVDTRFARTY